MTMTNTNKKNEIQMMSAEIASTLWAHSQHFNYTSALYRLCCIWQINIEARMTSSWSCH